MKRSLVCIKIPTKYESEGWKEHCLKKWGMLISYLPRITSDKKDPWIVRDKKSLLARIVRNEKRWK